VLSSPCYSCAFAPCSGSKKRQRPVRLWSGPLLLLYVYQRYRDRILPTGLTTTRQTHPCCGACSAAIDGAALLVYNPEIKMRSSQTASGEVLAVSSHSLPGSGNGASAGSDSFSQRREGRSSNGATPASSPQASGGQSAGGPSGLDSLIAELRELFERDRQIASQPDSTRCGICYLHYRLSDLRWRDEGFYICRECERLLGKQTMPMLRRQQRQS
jgi:hypothetical protein